MANPRKFSEKIALHTHRQAEETAAFNKIMKEVIEATAKEEPSHSGKVRVGRSGTRCHVVPVRKTHERRLDTSPYYLSPPTDTGWRRTNSDSALHQSTMQGIMDRNNECSNRGWQIPIMNGPDRNHQDHRRPRSSCDIPSSTSRVPGINIHPSHEPSLVQIPLANTGSLPDLTNVDFPSPIHAPLDQDHDRSPYSPVSPSPLNTSPSTLSPTNIPLSARPQNRFHFTASHPNQLTVPFSPRYHQNHQNIQLDTSLVNMVDNTTYTQLPCSTGMYQQHCPSTSPSPTLQQTGPYRSPRPSPQSSPSPGRHSAPCSPGATSPLSNEYLLNQPTTQFHQDFQQLSMLDPPNSMSYVDQSAGAQQVTQPHSPSNIPNASPINSMEMSTDAGYYSTSPQQLVYPSASPGLRTTPNTPTSLPEIILTGDDGSRQLSTEFLDESLKEGLGTLDFDEFQILTNPSIGISEMIEDNFRLDHRS